MTNPGNNVSHRVKEIRQLTDKTQWYHCPGIFNPADLPSRGISAKELIGSTIWWNGPAFLQLSEEKWPLTSNPQAMNDIIPSELIKFTPSVSYTFSTTTGNVSSLDQAIDYTHLGNMTCLLRVTALVLRFTNNCQMKGSTPNKRRKLKPNLPICLSASEIIEAERLWIGFVQANSFQAEIEFLLTGRSSKPILVDQFRLKLDDNKILRCQGRIGNSSLPLSSNEPIILPSKHYFVELLILDAHNKLKHSGVNDSKG